MVGNSSLDRCQSPNFGTGNLGWRRHHEWPRLRHGKLDRRFGRAQSDKLAHKDVSLANALGRELGMPMRMCNLTLAEMTEALARGWGGRDSRAVMLHQQERAGVEIAVDPERLHEALAPATPKQP